MVLDIGTLASQPERSVVATAVLNQFWNVRYEKEPLLLVIDEAHNVCPSQPSGRLEQLSTDHAIRIAGEGRKYGLYLLLASQRPAKLHPNIVSQCDNLILMKMNSRADLNGIAEVFSQVPVSLLGRAALFDQGESLVVGGITRSPTYVKFEGRFTKEGGRDVSTAWASPASPPNARGGPVR
jgi:hypothetical protein